MRRTEEVREVLEKAITELKKEGFEPDIIFVGPGFVEVGAEALRDFSLKIYKIKELGYDAVVADSSFLGLMKKASHRISVEPLISEDAMWDEIKKLDV